MKKVFSLLMCMVLLLSAASVVANAEGAERVFEYEVDGVEYTVTFEDSNLSPEKAEEVAKQLVGLSDGTAQTYGILCAIFGHDYVYSVSNVTVHKVRTSNPRCDVVKYEIVTCEDCGHTQQREAGRTKISCCP